ncbi:MAG: nicotinate-nicotinamide nucleotide adenylyltransferase [Desulfobacca sp.]|nr:nicotinate-nicotinamide nucleotide adenylyltransferase [Desulfobacca sp.]
MRREAEGLNDEGRKRKEIPVQGSKAETVPNPISEFGQKLSSPQSAIRNPKSIRLGLFGGTFNPIHSGHLRAGLEIQETFSLDRVLFIPTAIPPHKKTNNLLPFSHRVRMVRLAIAGHPFFKASDIEKKRKGKSYSIQTLRFFKKTYGSRADLFFIVGMDAFLEINTWKDYKELFALTHFVVMDRPGYGRRLIKKFLQKEVSPEFIFFPKENRFLLPQGFSVFLSPITLMDISSTRIRALRKKNQSIRYLLPEKVEEYILTKDLYAS